MLRYETIQGMKKGILLCLAAIIVAAIAAFAVITIYDGGAKEQSKKENMSLRSEIDDLLVFYIDLDQLATKGAFDQYLDENNRKMFATMASSAIANKSLASHASNIITDFSASGLNFKKPAYAYFNEDGNMVFVIEVKDVANVDKTVELLSFIYQEEEGEPLPIERNGKNRIIDLGGKAIIGYNGTRFVIAANTEGDDARAIAVDALKRPLSNLSIFGDSDIAIYANYDKSYGIMRNILETTKAEYEELALEDDYFEGSVMEIEQVLTIFDSYSGMIKKGANAIVSLTFEAGRATLNSTVNGIDMSKAKDIVKLTNNKHLNYISDDAAIVVNIGINGKKYAEIIDLVLNSEFFTNSEYNTNEVNMIAGIACDAIKSINGDFTIAVEDIQGKYESIYDSYFDEYYGSVNVTGASASVMIDVDDSYIISNLGQFAGGFLRRQDNTHYYGSFSGLDIALGQDDNVLHAGINTTYDRKANSAADANWVPSVENSLWYAVVDVDNLMSYSYIKAANKEIMEDMDFIERDIYNKYIDLCDYAYISQMSLDEAEVVIVLDDKQTNALKQIVDVIMPTLSSLMMQNM